MVSGDNYSMAGSASVVDHLHISKGDIDIIIVYTKMLMYRYYWRIVTLFSFPQKAQRRIEKRAVISQVDCLKEMWCTILCKKVKYFYPGIPLKLTVKNNKQKQQVPFFPSDALLSEWKKNYKLIDPQNGYLSAFIL